MSYERNDIIYYFVFAELGYIGGKQYIRECFRNYIRGSYHLCNEAQGLGKAYIQENVQNQFITWKMKTHEQNKLEKLLNMSYEPYEAEAIMDAITNYHVEMDEFTELITNIKNNWRY